MCPVWCNNALPLHIVQICNEKVFLTLFVSAYTLSAAGENYPQRENIVQCESLNIISVAT